MLEECLQISVKKTLESIGVVRKIMETAANSARYAINFTHAELEQISQAMLHDHKTAQEYYIVPAALEKSNKALELWNRLENAVLEDTTTVSSTSSVSSTSTSSTSFDSSSFDSPSTSSTIVVPKKSQIIPRIGDWKCSNCQNINFRHKIECHRCHKTRLEVFEPLDNTNDWMCETCNNLNFEDKILCNKCKSPSPKKRKMQRPNSPNKHKKI